MMKLNILSQSSTRRTHRQKALWTTPLLRLHGLGSSLLLGPGHSKLSFREQQERLFTGLLEEEKAEMGMSRSFAQLTIKRAE